MHDYGDVYRKLTTALATIIFMKKDGSVRVMLGTRSLEIAAIIHGFQGTALGGIDNRCNIRNGNVGVIDMILGEARSFSIDRLIAIEFYENVTTREDYDAEYLKYKAFKASYEASQVENKTELQELMDTFK